MRDDRLRVPVEPDYASALGMATYCFARLEWDAVYCGEKLSPGYLGTVHEKTAGRIAREIAAFADVIGDVSIRERYAAAVADFEKLVRRRNDLVHANPATVDGEQRLVRAGKPWQAYDIAELADEFTACSIELNRLYHHVL